MKAALLVAIFAALAAAVTPLSEIRAMSAERRASNVWSVLVAGSNTYSNYRHQSDICAMYQELHAMGIPDEHIIVLMYDDIAQSSQNPRKGVIINTPGGPDVYKGTPKDYTGKTVTAKNFVAILEGQAPAGGSGKKLTSGPNDHVYVFFSDHGGNDILAFPTGEYLTSKMLYDGITTMASKKLFGKLVVNIEACEAGSMFYKYTFPENVYITTASPVAYSSYAWQWDDTVNAYVSDVWSWYELHYMIDGHRQNTLKDQFDYVEAAMSNYSQPCEYGDTKVNAMTLEDFFYSSAKSYGLKPEYKDVVRAWDVPFEAAKRMHAKVNSLETASALKQEESVRTKVDAVVKAVAQAAGVNAAPSPLCNNNNARCLDTLSVAWRSACGRSHDYLDSVAPVIAAACSRSSVDLLAIVNTINSECSALRL